MFFFSSHESRRGWREEGAQERRMGNEGDNQNSHYMGTKLSNNQQWKFKNAFSELEIDSMNRRSA